MEFNSERTACGEKKEAEILPLFAAQYFHLQAPFEVYLNRGVLTLRQPSERMSIRKNIFRIQFLSCMQKPNSPYPGVYRICR